MPNPAPENIVTPHPVVALQSALANIGAHREAMQKTSAEIAAAREQPQPQPPTGEAA